MRIVVSSGALLDLERVRVFLSHAGAEASAAKAQTAIEDAIESLAAQPALGRRLPETSLRELVVPFGRSAYIVRYQHLEHRQTIFVLRI